MELELADHIRSFRKERDLTQEQLAEVLGVTQEQSINGSQGYPRRRLHYMFLTMRYK